MSRSGLVRLIKSAGTVSVLDAIPVFTVSAAILAGLACWASGGQSVSPPDSEARAIYYPVTEASVSLRGRTEIAPIEVRPARPAGNPPPVAQLAQSGQGFLTNTAVSGIQREFWASESQGGHDFYGGRWAPENVRETSDGTHLAVERGNGKVSNAEVRSRQRLGYGRYEAVMQVGKGSGLVSAFFTYTGPYEGNPHDEIDIEFLGKDTSKVHFNYWRNGRKGHHATFDLPFDASAAPHLYAFDWQPDRITWYVDGEAYYTTEVDDPHIPQHAGRLYFSHWTGTQKMQAWHGKPDFASGTSTIVECASFTPVNEDGPACQDNFRPTAKPGGMGLALLTLSP